MTSGRLPIIRTPMGSKKNSEKIGRNPYLNSRSTFSNRRKEMAANIGSQPWLTRPLSPQPHTRQKRRALRLLLERFRFDFNKPNTPSHFDAKRRHHKLHKQSVHSQKATNSTLPRSTPILQREYRVPRPIRSTPAHDKLTTR